MLDLRTLERLWMVRKTRKRHWHMGKFWRGVGHYFFISDRFELHQRMTGSLDCGAVNAPLWATRDELVWRSCVAPIITTT